jgi:hypothetical protein
LPAITSSSSLGLSVTGSLIVFPSLQIVSITLSPAL